MDMLLLGESLTFEINDEHHGFWMPAGGNDGVAAIEVFFADDPTEITVSMETKASDDDDASPTTIGTLVLSSATWPKVFKFDVADAQDLVRYHIENANGDPARLHFQLVQPLWAPN